MKIILLALACAAHVAAAHVAAVPQLARAAPRRLDSADLWVTAGAGTYDEMQANCSAAGGHLNISSGSLRICHGALYSEDSNFFSRITKRTNA